MAKDGTYRGGRRVRAGAKPDALVDKLKKGHVAEILEPPVTELTPDGLPAPPDLAGEEMPEPGAYLSAVQRDGKPLGADIIYAETWAWLKARKCERLINKRLLESYAMAFARYVQCEEAATHYGLLGNAAGEGAKMAVLNVEEYEYSKRLAQGTEFLELASMPEFNDCYVDCLCFEEE